MTKLENHAKNIFVWVLTSDKAFGQKSNLHERLWLPFQINLKFIKVLTNYGMFPTRNQVLAVKLTLFVALCLKKKTTF